MFNRINEYGESWLRSRASLIRKVNHKAQGLFASALSYSGRLSSITKVCIAYLKGDCDLILNGSAIPQLYKASQRSPDGIARLRIGAPILGRHIVYIGSRLSERGSSASLLKTIMDLPEEAARNPYYVFNEIFGKSFFLGLGGQAGLHLRAKFKQHLNLGLFDLEAQRNVFELFQKLKHRYALNQTQSDVIKSHVQSFYAKVFFGFEFSAELSQFFNKVEKVAFKYFFYPKFMLLVNEEVQFLRIEYKRLLQAYLLDNIEMINMQARSDAQKPKNNYLIETILEKFPEAKNGNLSPEDLGRLSSDPDILACVSSLFAVSNLSIVLDKGLSDLFDTTKRQSQEFRNQIQDDLIENQYRTVSRELLVDKDKMPSLHAFYLETLKKHAPLAFISRYTKTGIQAEGVDVPPNSIVLFDLTAAKYQVNSAAMQLHQGLFTPFGLGRRMCPGIMVSEIIFKHYVASFVRHVKRMDYVVTFTHNMDIEFAKISREIEEQEAAPDQSYWRESVISPVASSQSFFTSRKTTESNGLTKTPKLNPLEYTDLKVTSQPKIPLRFAS
jgi:hypothetical protein